MPKSAILITGVGGEIGHDLLTHLAERDTGPIVALDLKPLDANRAAYCDTFIQGDIMDTALLAQVFDEHIFGTIYHLAAILSTQAERHPRRAQQVNVEGTLTLLQLAAEQSQQESRATKFMFPSSIAVYGLPDLETKTRVGPVKEAEWCTPATMYGCNKLYTEHLGRYYANFYRQLEAVQSTRIDFRALRFPGLISAATLPSGGTTDYAPEMFHHAAHGQPYTCFVRPDTRIPFMVMPDAVKALLALEAAPRENLTRSSYNVTSFSPSAQELYQRVKQAFPSAQVAFNTDPQRQQILDSWPEALDDTAARSDWDWSPDYDQQAAFDDYLLPALVARYASTS